MLAICVAFYVNLHWIFVPVTTTLLVILLVSYRCEDLSCIAVLDVVIVQSCWE